MSDKTVRFTLKSGAAIDVRYSSAILKGRVVVSVTSRKGTVSASGPNEFEALRSAQDKVRSMFAK